MKQPVIVFSLITFILCGSLGLAQGDDTEPSTRDPGSMECDEASIEDGIEMIINDMVSNLDYTATVVGIGGFDPTLAVIQENGLVDCVDDSRDASSFLADLPTTGFVDAQNRNAQIKFKNNVRRGIADVTILIGGSGKTYGEFLLILEGMTIKQLSDEGDVFSLFLSDNLLASEVPPTVYAISVTGGLDPIIYLVDENNNAQLDENEVSISCDDAGFDTVCWGNSVPLEGFYVSRTFNRQLDAFQFDAMLTYDRIRPEMGDYIHYRIGSYNGQTFGDYVAVFHIGIADPSAPTEEEMATESTEEAVEATEEAVRVTEEPGEATEEVDS